MPDSSSINGDGDGEMKLHDEVGFELPNGHSTNGDAHTNGVVGRARRGSVRKSYQGSSDLPSVEETEQDAEHPDHDMERPSTSGTGVSPPSSMEYDIDDDVDDVEDGDEDGDEDMEIERGRKGRDGRPVGKRVGRKGKSVSVGAGVKMKEENEPADTMEVS